MADRDIETAPGALDPHRRARDRIIRFDPSISTGQIMQIGVVIAACVAAYGTYSADRARQTMEVEQIKVDATAQRTQMKESLGELRGDVKDIQRTLADVSQSMAVLKARSEPQQMRRVP